MQDIIRIPEDLGRAIHQARKHAKLKATLIAERSGKARNVLYRLERGEDVTVSSLLDILRAMGLTIRLVPLGLPTLDEMRQRFALDDDESDDPADAKGPARGPERAA